MFGPVEPIRVDPKEDFSDVIERIFPGEEIGPCGDRSNLVLSEGPDGRPRVYFLFYDWAEKTVFCYLPGEKDILKKKSLWDFFQGQKNETTIPLKVLSTSGLSFKKTTLKNGKVPVDVIVAELSRVRFFTDENHPARGRFVIGIEEKTLSNGPNGQKTFRVPVERFLLHGGAKGLSETTIKNSWSKRRSKNDDFVVGR